MKATVQTRIFVGMTVDEAREAVTQATDLQLAVRAALYEIDGMPVAEMVAPKPKLLAAPKKPKTKRTNRKHAPNKECPHCHEMKNPQGYYRHIALCKIKHPDAPVSLPDEEDEYPGQAAIERGA